MSSGLQLQAASVCISYLLLPELPVPEKAHLWVTKVTLPSIAVYTMDIPLSPYCSVPLLGLFTVPWRFRCFSQGLAAVVRM